MHNQNTISIAKIDDADEIMKFIDNEWKKGHILGISKDYFLYEYKNKDHLNFVISKNQTNKINGILGFIRSSSDDNATVWTTMWKVSKSSGSPMLGVDILNFLRRQGFKTVMSLGINLKTEEIYNYLGFNVGIMNHHFVLSPDKTVFRIAKVPSRICVKNMNSTSTLSYKLITKSDLDHLDTSRIYLHQIPSKSDTYIVNRFMNHPIYKYHVYAITDADQVLAICVIRPVSQDRSIVLRFVDFMGTNEVFALLGQFVHSLLDEYEAEYLDFYSHGIPIEYIEKAGFLNRQEYDDLIIPNYFEPFERKNVDLRYAYEITESQEDVRLFKSDGDQDRPSII
tara:strand:- start:457 stop:1473 length:1017 start_codon:yes stop_codon:yes gene_type:complete